LLQLKKITQNLAATFCQNTLGMELDAPDWELFVLHAHNLAFFSFGSNFEAVGQRLALDYQRMVTRRGKRIRHALEKVFPVMFNQRGLAMHHPIIDHDISAENMADALMAEADAQRWNARAEIANDLVREPGLARRARARR